MKKIFSILILLGVMIAGCAHKGVVKPTELPKKEAPVENKQTETKKIETQRLSDTGESREISERELANRRATEMQKTIKDLEAKFHDIYFDYDQYAMRDDAKSLLKQVSSALLTNERVKLLVEGNCDERGTAEYNAALGDRRANSAKQYLLSLGIPSSRIETISYGKEKPVCTESNEKCWAKNRRDHFVFE